MVCRIAAGSVASLAAQPHAAAAAAAAAASLKRFIAATATAISARLQCKCDDHVVLTAAAARRI